MKNSKYVTDWWVEVYEETGMYNLTMNLTERWLPYHQFNDEMYIFGTDIEDENGNINHDDWISRIQEVPEFLPKNKSYVPTVIQNKEQISFYFIPMYMVRTGKMILQSKTSKQEK